MSIYHIHIVFGWNIALVLQLLITIEGVKLIFNVFSCFDLDITLTVTFGDLFGCLLENSMYGDRILKTFISRYVCA